MTDVFDKAKRSEVMSAIKSKGNKSTELALLNIFRQHHIKGWRRNSELIGKPDFVFPKPRIVVFVDGCFWHGHNCRKRRPAQNDGYWKLKLERNQRRDRNVNSALRKKGWYVIRFWECELKKEKYLKKLSILETKLKGDKRKNSYAIINSTESNSDASISSASSSQIS